MIVTTGSKWGTQLCENWKQKPVLIKEVEGFFYLTDSHDSLLSKL